mmetsp:Transcript_10083/g.17358  ORF Transcript_10083/g.17358 Transcript_10083/m.17358 type:complete len:323 (-) Transcript_10083:637-1605(-)
MAGMAGCTASMQPLVCQRPFALLERLCFYSTSKLVQILHWKTCKALHLHYSLCMANCIFMHSVELFRSQSRKGSAAGCNKASHVILRDKCPNRKNVKVWTVRVQVGLPFVVGKELLRLAQSLFELAMRIHDVGQWPSPHSCPMRGISRHPVLHKSPLRAVHAFDVNVTLKGSARFIAINRLPMELCLPKRIRQAITSCFHEGLLGRPKAGKSLVLPVQTRTMRLHILPFFVGQVVLEDIMKVNWVSIFLRPSQLSHVNTSNHVSFAGTNNPFAFMGTIHIPVGCLLFWGQRIGQERLPSLCPFDLDVIEVRFVQGGCTCLTN